LVGNQTLFETGKIRIANLAVGVASVPKSLSLRYANTQIENTDPEKNPADNMQTFELFIS
jgi:hypothetical protein